MCIVSQEAGHIHAVAEVPNSLLSNKTHAASKTCVASNADAAQNQPREATRSGCHALRKRPTSPVSFEQCHGMDEELLQEYAL